MKTWRGDPVRFSSREPAGCAWRRDSLPEGAYTGSRDGDAVFFFAGGVEYRVDVDGPPGLSACAVEVSETIKIEDVGA